MNKKAFLIAAIPGILTNIVLAEGNNLADRLAEAKKTIKQEQALNTELKEKLAETEKLIAELKQRAQTLDEQIAAIKKEHGINEDA